MVSGLGGWRTRHGNSGKFAEGLRQLRTAGISLFGERAFQNDNQHVLEQFESGPSALPYSRMGGWRQFRRAPEDAARMQREVNMHWI
jgi:hypothetical protein